MRGGKLNGRSRLALLGLGITLLLAAWIVATHPWEAPDEASHYLRAMSIDNGQIIGPKIKYADIQLTPSQEAFIDHDTTAVEVPARLSPPDVWCATGHPDLHGTCIEKTPNGNFPPIGYFLPAAAIKVSNTATTGLWLTRTASLLQSLAFLLLAAALLWDGTGWSVLGLLAAVSPMVLFSSSVMNSSGIQICSSLAFAAAALRITRDPTEAPRWTWVAFAVAGAVSILSGPIGLAFGIIDLALFAALLGPGGLRELRAGNLRPLRVSASVLAAAGVLSLVYSRVAGFPTRFSISPIRYSLHLGLEQLKPVLRDAVGDFASQTVHLPLIACWIWWLLVLALLAVGVWLGDRRERLLLGAVTAVALAFPVLFYAWVDRFSDFGLQGREVLPVLMLLPLVSGEVVHRHRAAFAQRRPAQVLLGAAIALIALFQAYAWWYSARAAAGALGTIRFYAHATWSPPLGWMPWIVLAGLATIVLLTFAVREGAGGRLALQRREASVGRLRGSRPRMGRSG